MPVTRPRIRPVSPARRLAFEVLEDVAQGAYASDSLQTRSPEFDSRDAGLASQIVFGCLRFQAQLDWLIRQYAGRSPETLDLPVLIALRAAVFQLRYLDRIPPHAAVNESVEWVKARRRAASGLANAVLRKVNRTPVNWPDLATELSCPDWLLSSWTAQFGPDAARRIAEAALVEPLHYVRRSAARPPIPDGLEPTGVPGCFRVSGPAPDGARLQDIGSQAIIPLLNLQPGLTYLDLCAAPGNKTLQALETQLGLAVACDISPARIRQIPPVLPRVVLDASRTLPFNCSFDRVFVDAPCSGTGTLARNPEIKWRLQRSDLSRFQERQISILRNAVSVLPVGGRLVYATCSLEAEENGDVVRTVLTEIPNIHLETEVLRIPGRDEGDGFYAVVLSRIPTRT